MGRGREKKGSEVDEKKRLLKREKIPVWGANYRRKAPKGRRNDVIMSDWLAM
jgi:hypothetical protein